MLTLGLTPIIATGADACTDFEFIGGRGSGQSSDSDRLGMGKELFKAFGEIEDAVADAGLTITGYGVNYPAVSVFGGDDTINGLRKALHLGGAYDESVAKGTQDVIDRVTERHSECPSMRFIVGGYSQGAHAVGNAIQQLPGSTTRSIVASLYFGDPLFNGEDGEAGRGGFDPNHNGAFGARPFWGLSSPVFSYCHNGDPICGLTKKLVSLPFGKEAMVRDIPHVYKVTHDAGGGLFDFHTNYIDADVSRGARKVIASLGLSTAGGASVPTDVVFTIDTTGSMGSAIVAVKANVKQLADRIAATSPSYRLALVEYKDDSDAFQSRLVVPFTTDLDVFGTGLDGLSADGGGDWPESVYSGVMTALNQPWRDGVRKTVIVIGDAPAKDPEPVTQYTAADVVKRAFEVDPAQVYPVVAGGDSTTVAQLQALADGTNGKLFTSGFGQDVVPSIEAALDASGVTPLVGVTGPDSADTGAPTLLSAAGTSDDPSDPVVSYEWNFGETSSDTVDVASTSPVVPWTFASAGSYTVAVRATTASGISAQGWTTVTVTDPPTAAPTTPSELTAIAGDGSSELQWSASGESAVFLVEDGEGRIIDAFSPAPDESPITWSEDELTNGIPQTYQVVAVNPAGASTPAGPVTVTPGGGAVVAEPALVSATTLSLTNNVSVVGATTRVVVAGDAECDSSAGIAGDLVATGRVYLTNSCVIGGSVVAGAGVVLDSGSRVAGDIIAVGDVSVSGSAAIGGDVTTGGTFVSLDGVTLDALGTAGLVTGTVTTGASVGAPAAPFRTYTVPVGRVTTSWRNWLNSTAATNGAPSWSQGLTATPGCVMAPWSSSVAGDTVSVPAALVIDARQEVTGCASVTLQSMTIALGADLTIVANGFSAIGGLRAMSVDGEPHVLRVLVPGSATGCASGHDIAIPEGGQVSPLIGTQLFTPGKVAVNGTLALTGQILAGCVQAEGRVSLAGQSIVTPGMS